jgi:hypothetical protein
MAEGDMVMFRGRFSGHDQPAPWIVVDTVRVRDGELVEHWDVIEDEVSGEASVSDCPCSATPSPKTARNPSGSTADKATAQRAE